MCSRSQLKITLHVLSIRRAFAKAKLIIFLFMCLRDVRSFSIFVATVVGGGSGGKGKLELLPRKQLTQVIRYFLEGRSGTWGLHTSHTSGHDHSATPSPSPGPALSHLAPKTRDVFFSPAPHLPPCSKCTSGSHLTPVRPNFHFRGRCGFQIIYHFPKCFHMCAAFPSARGSCLRPTFSKCIKIQFGPKKFRH